MQYAIELAMDAIETQTKTGHERGTKPKQRARDVTTRSLRCMHAHVDTDRTQIGLASSLFSWFSGRVSTARLAHLIILIVSSCQYTAPCKGCRVLAVEIWGDASLVPSPVGACVGTFTARALAHDPVCE